MGIDGYNALNKYPTLQDGLALLYAAGEIGDKKATKLAREAAYTEQPSKSSDSKNEGKSTGGGVSKVDYGTNNTPTPTPVNYSYDQNENKGRSIYENNPRANSRDKNNPNIIFSEYIPVKERIYNSLVPDNKNCLTLDDKKKIYAIKNSEDVSTEHAKIMYFSEQWKDVPEVKWTTAKRIYWKTFGGDDYIHNEKLAFIKNYKDVILDAAEKYDIPPILLAGVAYVEYGGAYMWIDDVAHSVRSIDWSGPKWVDENFTITKNPDLTSFGNTSIQVRRALEMLGYDTSTTKRDAVIDSLKDPIQNIYMAACHLDVLRNVDYEGKAANDLTEDEIKIIASRYNLGPDIALNAIVTDYGDRVYNNKNDILKALS